MFGLGKHGPDGRYGALIDVGSGSVGVAVVASDPLETFPEVIWSTRERMPVYETNDIVDTAKNISTTILNTMLLLGSEGTKALVAHDPRGRIDTIQIVISAPWSYTITKTITYTDEKPFEISRKLVKELTHTAEKQALDVIDENDIMEKLSLEVISKVTASITANGYVLNDTYGQTASSVSVSHISAIAQKHILTTIREGSHKIYPKADEQTYSFMLVFYEVLRLLSPDTSEVCLVDVTFEATEIGIVRDGILKYSTHTPFGAYTIAREIAEKCAIPKEEALAYLRGAISLSDTLSKAKQQTLEEIEAAYETKIMELFKRTGDALSIPRPLFLHTDAYTETFFQTRIKKAASGATKGEHSIHLVTSKLLEGTLADDTALLLSAYFFHKCAAISDGQ